MMIAVTLVLFFFFLASKAQGASVVTVAESCYTIDESITIAFSVRIARPTDLIGIALSNDTKTLLLSIPLCDPSTPTCINRSRSGNVTFALQQDVITFGLSYKAVILREGVTRELAISSTFAVARTCEVTNSPSTSPTPKPTRKPTRKPTKSPTLKPTPAPTRTPTMSPTLRPTTQPTTAAPTPPPIEVVSSVLIQAEILITGLVKNNPRLSPEFMRMGFHDCIGGCDGCIDLTNPDNNGLANPISVLEPIVRLFVNPKTGLSRSDIWALASMVGAKAAPKGSLSQPVTFSMKWIGRVDCENANSVCRNNQGQIVACTSTVGPGRVMPSPNLDSQGVFNYFDDNFGFNQRQTITIMGAHTMGHLQQSESGFDGSDGWVIDNTILQNEYYAALMGVATAATPVNQITSVCPDWARKFTNNDGTGIPNRNGWALNVQGKALTMLDSDVSLVRDLNSGNLDPSTGAVSCAFSRNTARGSPLCSLASTISTVEEFAANNDQWTKEFAVVLDLMLTNGYDRNFCSDVLCRLTPQ